jgi:hypothetical protein
MAGEARRDLAKLLSVSFYHGLRLVWRSVLFCSLGSINKELAALAGCGGVFGGIHIPAMALNL